MVLTMIVDTPSRSIHQELGKKGLLLTGPGGGCMALLRPHSGIVGESADWASAFIVADGEVPGISVASALVNVKCKSKN